MSDERVSIRVSSETNDIIRKYAEEREIPVGDAADRLISTAIGRLEALKTYGKKQSKIQKAEARAKRARAAKRKAAQAEKAKAAA